MATKQFTLSPWHVYTCVFIAFWLCSACFNTFPSTIVLCILFGLISDSLNKYMVIGEDYLKKSKCQVVQEGSISQFGNNSLLTESQEVVTDIQSSISSKRLEETHASQQQNYPFFLFSKLDDDAPTKPLPPEPDDIGHESDVEDEIVDQNASLDCFLPKTDCHRHVVKEEDLGAELLDPLDEYDKHPIPESVEFVDSNTGLQENEIICKDDTGDNTSPSQDSFQMLDMGSDSEASKPIQDDLFPDSKDFATSSCEKGLEDTLMMSTDDNIPTIIKGDDDIIETLVPPLVQFTDSSNVDSHQTDEPVLANVSDNDKIRQTSKEFVEELMEEALTITSEQQFQDNGGTVGPNVDLMNDTNSKKGLEEEKNTSKSSSPSTSPRDLMEELLGSVHPPSTSPPEIISDTEVKFLEGTTAGGENDIDVLGGIRIENKGVEDDNELEKLLSDAQKDDGGKDNNSETNDNEEKEQGTNVQKDEGEEENKSTESSEVEVISDNSNKQMIIESTPVNPENRKDSSSDYDEENHDIDEAANDDDKDANEKGMMRRAISSDYEEENDDVGQLVTNEQTKRNKPRKRDSSSDYDEGNDNDVVDDNESSESDIGQEMEIKTKTLADLDEGDPWTVKAVDNDNDKVVCSEDTEEHNNEGGLHHLDSDDLPAQDDMSHRAVFGDDDDRNEEDVLLEEDEDEAKEREQENRKLSTTVPTLMEENETLAFNQGLEHKNQSYESSHILEQDNEDEQKNGVVASSTAVPSDSSLLTEVETALEAKETSEISADIFRDKGLAMQAHIKNETSSTIAGSSSDVVVDINEKKSASEGVKDEPLIEF